MKDLLKVMKNSKINVESQDNKFYPGISHEGFIVYNKSYTKRKDFWKAFKKAFYPKHKKENVIQDTPEEKDDCRYNDNTIDTRFSLNLECMIYDLIICEDTVTYDIHDWNTIQSKQKSKDSIKTMVNTMLPIGTYIVLEFEYSRNGSDESIRYLFYKHSLQSAILLFAEYPWKNPEDLDTAKFMTYNGRTTRTFNVVWDKTIKFISSHPDDIKFKNLAVHHTIVNYEPEVSTI